MAENQETVTLPSVGDIVLYYVPEGAGEPLKHNHANVLPAIIVQVWSEDCVNLKVFCDGPVDAWVTSVPKGTDEGYWQYIPERST
jgi:hypothetical protein